MTAAGNTDLLARAKRLDHQALGEIYDQYSSGIFRYAYRLLGDACQAEDCVAETFSRFLWALNGGHGPKDFLQAYLYRVAHNWITDYYRRQPLPSLEILEEHPSSEPHLEDSAAQRLLQEKVRAALLRLTPEQRQVIMLKYYENWDNDQVAAAMDRPVGAIKALQHRAIETLRRLLCMEDPYEPLG